MAEVKADVEELPLAVVRRMVKDKLSNCSSGDEITVHKDALRAFSESTRIFIHYLSATADDICKESKRQLITADDVFKALEEIEFPEFVEPLKTALDDFRQKNAAKKSNIKDKAEKRKMDGDPSLPNEAAPRENSEEAADNAEENKG